MHDVNNLAGVHLQLVICAWQNNDRSALPNTVAAYAY